VIPYTRGDLVSRAHSTGEVLHEEHLEGGTRLRALVDSQLAAEIDAAIVPAS
jgi:GTP-binding protein HflX